MTIHAFDMSENVSHIFPQRVQGKIPVGIGGCAL